MSRDYDIVVFGATGFTGRLVCEYLAKSGELASTRLAIAGRNAAKLEQVRHEVAATHPAFSDVGLIVADSSDEASLAAMVQQTRVVLTTVGPYVRYGEPLLAACAEHGTDYVDLTGEPGWWRDMIARYHERAEQTGARIVPACGFDSIPFDLGVLFTANLLPPDGPRRVRGYLTASATASGGTWNTALGIMSGTRKKKGRVATGSSRRGPRRTRRRGVHRPEELSGWAVPMPTIDPLIVRRSSQLRDDLGDELSYEHYFHAKSTLRGAGLGLGLGVVFGLAQFGPTRRLLGRLRQPGEGPSAERRARSWFRVDLFGEGSGQRVHARVSGGDPGYDETAKMISEAALCLIHDDLPESGGVLTTASVMGEKLVGRLDRAGLTFRQIT